MTQTRSKLISTIASAALAATLLAPFASAAAMDGSIGAGANASAPTGVMRTRPNLGSSGQDGVSAGGRMAPVAAQFCAMIGNRMQLMQERMGGMKSKLDTERSNRDSRVSTRQENRSNILKTARNTQDIRLNGIVDMLNAKATTDAQKAAVASFQAGIKAALIARRTAVDQADADFKTGMEKLRVDHMTGVDAAVTALDTAIQAALDQANSDCTAGSTGATVRAAMMKSIEAARAKFKTDTAGIDKIGPAAKALADAHRAAVDKAFAAFKTAAEAARKALKAAFPGDAKDGMMKTSGMMDANVNAGANVNASADTGN